MQVDKIFLLDYKLPFAIKLMLVFMEIGIDLFLSILGYSHESPLLLLASALLIVKMRSILNTNTLVCKSISFLRCKLINNGLYFKACGYAYKFGLYKNIILLNSKIHRYILVCC